MASATSSAVRDAEAMFRELDESIGSRFSEVATRLSGMDSRFEKLEHWMMDQQGELKQARLDLFSAMKQMEDRLSFPEFEHRTFSDKERGENSGHANGHGETYSSLTRLGKIAFPRFNGDKVLEWLFEVERFFELDNTPADLRVGLISIHLDGEASNWHRALFQADVPIPGIKTWEVYKPLITSRFEVVLDDPVTALKNLTENDGILAYHRKFEELRAKISLSEESLVSIYLAGLSAQTQSMVRMFKPPTVKDCLELGRLYEFALVPPTSFSAWSTTGQSALAPTTTVPKVDGEHNAISGEPNFDAAAEASHVKNTSQGDVPFSGPLQVSVARCLAWEKRGNDDICVRSYNRPLSRDHIPNLLGPSLAFSEISDVVSKLKENEKEDAVSVVEAIQVEDNGAAHVFAHLVTLKLSAGVALPLITPSSSVFPVFSHASHVWKPGGLVYLQRQLSWVERADHIGILKHSVAGIHISYESDIKASFRAALYDSACKKLDMSHCFEVQFSRTLGIFGGPRRLAFDPGGKINNLFDGAEFFKNRVEVLHVNNRAVYVANQQGILSTLPKSRHFKYKQQEEHTAISRCALTLFTSENFRPTAEGGRQHNRVEEVCISKRNNDRVDVILLHQGTQPLTHQNKKNWPTTWLFKFGESQFVLLEEDAARVVEELLGEDSGVENIFAHLIPLQETAGQGGDDILFGKEQLKRQRQQKISKTWWFKFKQRPWRNKVYTTSLSFVRGRMEQGGVSAIAFHPTRSMAVSTSFGGDFKIWVCNSDKDQTVEDSSWKCHAVGSYKKKPMTAAAFSGDGTVLAVAAENVITLWNPDKNILLSVLGATLTPITKLCFAGKSEFLVAASHFPKPELSVWNTSKLSLSWSYGLRVEAVTSAVDSSAFAVLALIPETFRKRKSKKKIFRGRDGAILLFNGSDPKPVSMWTVMKAEGGSISFLEGDKSQLRLAYVNGSHEYVVFDPNSDETHERSAIDYEGLAGDEETGDVGYTSLYGKLPDYDKKRMENVESLATPFVSSERPWETIFSGSTLNFPPLPKLCAEFFESLMEKRTAVVE